MVFRILFLVVFLIAISLFAFFILNILFPSLKKQMLQNKNSVFSPLELNYVRRAVDNNVKPTDMRAVVLCAPKKDEDEKQETRLEYNGIKNCALFEHTYGTLTNSNWDCIGFGDCAAVCPQQAIIVQNGVAIVTSSCCGCGTCLNACPKKLIELFPKDKRSVEYKNDEKKSHIIEIPEKKDFKFWQTCYRMLG